MSPFPQGPHCHQGPPFPHGGIDNPWLGPPSASYVNIQDPKQRRIAFDNVQEHIKEALGSTKYEGPPAQVPSSGSLTPRNDPVCFSDLITEPFYSRRGEPLVYRQTTLFITRRQEQRSFTLRPIGSRP